MVISIYSVTSLYSQALNRRLRAWHPKVNSIPSLIFRHHVICAYFGSHSMILYMYCCISYSFLCYKSPAAQGRFSCYAIIQSSSALVMPPSRVSSTTFTSTGSLFASGPLVKILNATSPETEPWGTPSILHTVVSLSAEPRSSANSQHLPWSLSSRDAVIISSVAYTRYFTDRGIQFNVLLFTSLEN